MVYNSIRLFLEHLSIWHQLYELNSSKDTKMPIKRIVDIRPEESPKPAEIRIIKKWKPYLQKKPDLWFLFVDVRGDAIKAMCPVEEESLFMRPNPNAPTCPCFLQATSHKLAELADISKSVSQRCR
ncbi:hypothetical protein QVD17_16206 [Tagetes erecta]|uniref:Uncharacterized protein n=1 Tax=Tagetes erecta TaxID=13708 RepID=A0AAD8P0H2_TARER|nr:hypothetical protein QVD17_16206 [Tagetes erecta]